ncbi:MAG: hypothetical protein EF813_11050 [Methanosarcinales archaeon]|nr:MAG: hypothetical protein EF813_11050 [Methanosarcinales archaeon]
MERLSEVLKNGAETWKQNPVLCMPFLLIFFFQMLLLAFLLLGLAAVIGTDTITGIQSQVSEIVQMAQYSDTPQIEGVSELMRMIAPFKSVFIVAATILVIGCVLIQAFFSAGAIGMARTATMTGTTRTRDILVYGMQSGLNLFFAGIVVMLLFLVGVVFMLPGAFMIMVADRIVVPAIIMLIGSIFLFLYVIVLSIGLAPVKYAIVVNHTGPIEGITSGWSFFSHHKMDVFLMWLLMIGISMVLGIAGQIFYINPILVMVWQFVGTLINLVIVMPLVTVWWTRLYISRTVIAGDAPVSVVASY